MLYPDDAGVVSQPSEQLRKNMGVIVVVCAAFGLTSEAKTEIVCLRVKAMPESTAISSVEDATCPSRSTGAYAMHGAASGKYTLKLYDRSSAPLELKIRMLRAEVLETMLYGCVTWSSRACHYDSLRRAHHRFLTRCIDWRKHNRADHPISYLDTLIKTGRESIEATLRRRRI